MPVVVHILSYCFVIKYLLLLKVCMQEWKECLLKEQARVLFPEFSYKVGHLLLERA